MATELATAYVTLIPSFRGGQAAIQKELGPAADKAGTQTGASSGKKFVGSFGREAKNVGKSIAIGAGLAVAGAAVFKFAKNATTGYKNIGKEVLLLQRYTGASAEEASKLRFVFQQTGIDANAGARGIAIFSKKIVASKDSVKDFGIETRDSSGQLLPMTVLLGKAADKTAHMSNQTDKLAYAQKLFGKGGVEYLKILDKGKQGIDDLAAGAEKYGLILTGKNLAAIKEATANERAQTAAYQGLQVQVGQYLLPVFTRWTGFVATEIPKATAFLHDNAGSVKVIGAAVGGTIALFGAYKAAQIGSTVATGAWSAVTGVAAAAQWVYNEALYAGVAASYALEGAALAATVGVGAIAAGVGVVGAIYKQAADKTARVAAETDNLTEAYRKEVAGQKLAVSQSLIHMLTLDRLGKRYVQLGGSTEGYAQVVQAIPDKIRRLGTSYQDLTLTQHGFDKALKLSGIAGTEWEGILRGMYATLGAADFRDWIGGQAGVAAALETAKSSTNEATSATKAHTSAADRDKKAVQESNAAYKAWRAAVDAAYKKFQDFTNYKIGTTNASIAYAQALADETQAFKDNGYSIDTTTQKGRDNKTAMIASRQAILQQAEALNVGKDGAKIAAKYIIDHTAALSLQEIKAGQSTDSIRALNEETGLTPVQVATQFDTPGLAAAYSDVQKLNSALGQIPPYRHVTIDVSAIIPSNVKLPVNLNVGSNAKGTDNWRGGLTWVGEQGPELLNLPRGSQIIPNRQSIAMVSGGSVGASGRAGAPLVAGDLVLANGVDVESFARRLDYEMSAA